MNWSASWHRYRIGGGNLLWRDCLILKIITLITRTLWTWTSTNISTKYSNRVQSIKLFNNNINKKIDKDLNKMITIVKGFWILLWLCSPHRLLKVTKTILVIKKIINIIKKIRWKRNNNKNRYNKNNFYSINTQQQIHINKYLTNKLIQHNITTPSPTTSHLYMTLTTSKCV